MKNILVDAGPLIALFNNKDRHHQRILGYVKGYDGKMVTTWPVITEVMHMLSFNNLVQIDFLKWVDAGGLEIVSREHHDIARLIQLTDQYKNVPMDLADASLILLSETVNIKEVLTIDSDF